MPEVRLIDGNRLAELFESAAERGAGVLATVYRDAAHLARTAQEIEAKPVRHGRWIVRDGISYCSNCGSKKPVIGYRYYCGCCGADMRTPTDVSLDIADSVMMGGAGNA